MHEHRRVVATDKCPLCDRRARASDGLVNAARSLFRCRACCAFVIDRRLIEVVANARAKNLQPVLRYLTALSAATRAAAWHGSVLEITSTNWIRVATQQRRLEAELAGTTTLGYARAERDEVDRDGIHRLRVGVSGTRHARRL